MRSSGMPQPRKGDWSFECRIRRADGEIRWIWAAGRHRADLSGGMRRMAGIVQDITERKRAAEALRESEQRLRMAQQAARIGSFEWNIQTNVNTWTPELEAMYGLQPGQFGRTEAAWEQLVHPEDREPTIALVNRTFETGEPVEGEWRVQWADGSVHWIYGRFQLQKDEAGKPLRLTGVNIDITERKQAQAELEQHRHHLEELVHQRTAELEAANVQLQAEVTDRKRAEAALRDSERFVNSVAAASPHCFYLFDFDTMGLSYENRPIVRDLGYPPEVQEAVRHLDAFRELMPPEEMPHLARLLDEWRTLPDGHVRDDEYYLRHADGTIHSFAGRELVFARRPDGSVRQILGSLLDITGRKQAEEALRESELFYRQTLESIPGMVFTTRPDGYCDYQSQQWVDYTGVPMSEHLGDGWNKLLHPDDRPRAYAAWRDAVEGRAPYDLEYRVRRHDGQYEWFKVIGRPIRDARGQIVRWFGVAANINDLKRAEQQLKDLNETLERRVTARTEEADHRARQLSELAAELTRAEQRERQRIAQVLHDHLQQLLVGARFNVSVVRSQDY